MSLLDLGIGATDVADTSDDWYTPRWLFDAAGLTFDMDVCAPVDPTRRTCPARRYLTPLEDGLTTAWEGLVWMNPPYSRASPWIEKFATHRCGLALLPARKEVHWLGTLLRCAEAMAIVNVEFSRPNGSAARLPFAMLLVGVGGDAIYAVEGIARADLYADGACFLKSRTTS